VGVQRIEDFTLDLIAQLFNPDLLIRETAAWSLFQIDPDLYHSNVERLGDDVKRNLDYSILDRGEKSTLMLYDKVLFFQQIPLFEGIAGLTLSLLADISKTVMLGKDKFLAIDERQNNDFYIIFKGEVQYYEKSKYVTDYQTGQFIGERLASSGFVNSNMVSAKEDTVLLRFNKDRFYELLSDHVKLANKVLEYI
jgi:ATP:ADP antiporter, AAA family